MFQMCHPNLRDLAAANVLLNNDGVAKVADFGLSGRIEQIKAGGKFRVKWSAPEALKDNNVSWMYLCLYTLCTSYLLTSAVDIWKCASSYHIVICEYSWVETGSVLFSLFHYASNNMCYSFHPVNNKL